MARVWGATVDDLARVRGKAELVNGELVVMTPGGGTHGYAAGAIHASLFEYARRTKNGIALPERALAAKRTDYFAAGTLVVWDVDLEDGVVHGR